MAKQLQLRRGNYLENETFIGAEAEITFDTERKDIRIHDGVKRGGYKIPTLVDSQMPTADNGYTWYRLWSDGWVEQGGKFTRMNATNVVISLPILMASSVYSIIGTGNAYSNTSGHFAPKSATTTSFTADIGTDNGNGGWWQVSGISAQGSKK